MRDQRVLQLKKESYNMYLSPRKKLFVDTASEMFGCGSIISKSDSIEVSKKLGSAKILLLFINFKTDNLLRGG